MPQCSPSTTTLFLELLARFYPNLIFTESPAPAAFIFATQAPCQFRPSEASGCIYVLPILWRGDVVVRASDLQPIGHRFESRPLCFTNDPGQVVHTHVPLFTKQYKLVPANGQ